jgi:hypothetical protein
MADDGGVLGNLPRSRPGHRSDKRTETTAAKAAGRAERSGAKAAAPAGAKAAPAGGTKPAPASSAPPRDTGADPVGGAIRTVAGVAGIGAKIAGGVAREVLRRLPRP